jgi:hypothetical protein
LFKFGIPLFGVVKDWHFFVAFQSLLSAFGAADVASVSDMMLSMMIERSS